MPTAASFNSTVAARTRAADQILRSKDLLATYEGHGGLKDDLTFIRDVGHKAEALNQAQSGAQAAGGAATLAVLETFAGLQKEYKSVMAVVQAVLHDLQRAKAPHDVLAALEKILVNEAEVAVRSVADGVDAQGKPVKKRAARRKVTQEALRAEIAKDAAALLALKPAHAALGKRRVDAKRLARLQAEADALAGKLADRAAAKGSVKSATAAERESVIEQRRVWGAAYRILAAAGREDHRIAALLKEAARK